MRTHNLPSRCPHVATLRRGTLPRWPLCLAALIGMISSAAAAGAESMYRQVTLPELAQRAAIVVQGRVVEARYEGHPDYPNVSTVLVTLQVERMVRGPADGQFTFRQYLPGARAKLGKPDYMVGQRLLLFLPQPSRYDLSSPLGGDQGRFQVWRDARGNELVQNARGNAGLFRNVAEAAAKAGISLSPRQMQIAAMQRGAVPLEDFVELVRQFSGTR